MMLREVTLNYKYPVVAGAMCLWVSHKRLSTQELFTCKNINLLVLVTE